MRHLYGKCAASELSLISLPTLRAYVKSSTVDFELNSAARLECESIVLSCLTSGRHLRHRDSVSDRLDDVLLM